MGDLGGAVGEREEAAVRQHVEHSAHARCRARRRAPRARRAGGPRRPRRRRRPAAAGSPAPWPADGSRAFRTPTRPAAAIAPATPPVRSYAASVQRAPVAFAARAPAARSTAAAAHRARPRRRPAGTGRARARRAARRSAPAARSRGAAPRAASDRRARCWRPAASRAPGRPRSGRRSRRAARARWPPGARGRAPARRAPSTNSARSASSRQRLKTSSNWSTASIRRPLDRRRRWPASSVRIGLLAGAQHPLRPALAARQHAAGELGQQPGPQRGGLAAPRGADHAEQRRADQPRHHLSHEPLAPEEERGVVPVERREALVGAHAARRSGPQARPRRLQVDDRASRATTPTRAGRRARRPYGRPRRRGGARSRRAPTRPQADAPRPAVRRCARAAAHRPHGAYCAAIAPIASASSGPSGRCSASASPSARRGSVVITIASAGRAEMSGTGTPLRKRRGRGARRAEAGRPEQHRPPASGRLGGQLGHQAHAAAPLGAAEDDDRTHAATRPRPRGAQTRELGLAPHQRRSSRPAPGHLARVQRIQRGSWCRIASCSRRSGGPGSTPIYSLSADRSLR